MALNENRLDVAERLLKPHLKEDPFDVAAIRMLAELAGRIGRWRDAENLLRRAVELAPGWTAAKANLALVLGRMGRPAEALGLLDEIFAEEPDEVGHWNLKAATLGRLGDFDEAIRLYENVLGEAPEQPRVWLSYGHMLKTVGKQADDEDDNGRQDGPARLPQRRSRKPRQRRLARSEPLQRVPGPNADEGLERRPRGRGVEGDPVGPGAVGIGPVRRGRLRRLEGLEPRRREGGAFVHRLPRDVDQASARAISIFCTSDVPS